MQSIVFYISGHGYGHATRCIELILRLMQKAPDLFFYIKTDAQKWLFELNLSERYALTSLAVDVGAVQQTSFFIDKQQTLSRWQRLLAEKDAIIEQEVCWLNEIQARLVVGDIPPLAFEIASEAKIPSVGIANFSWDWIYSDYVSEYPDFIPVIDYIEHAYSQADFLLRLPFHGDLSAFHQIRDIPLIARKAHRSKEEVLDLLKIDGTACKAVILVALRATDLATANLERAFSNKDYRFVTFGLSENRQNSLDIAPDFLRFAELVQACDLVVSKPGYGIVSEIIANRVPLLYTSRTDFIEYPVLVKGLEDYAVSQHLPYEDFVAGNWDESLKRILHCEDHRPDFAVDGADKAAEGILDFMTSNYN